MSEPAPIKTATMTVKEYLADPGAATRLAERVGRVVVLDDTGARRMVLSSNRASETLLDK